MCEVLPQSEGIHRIKFEWKLCPRIIILSSFIHQMYDQLQCSNYSFIVSQNLIFCLLDRKLSLHMKSCYNHITFLCSLIFMFDKYLLKELNYHLQVRQYPQHRKQNWLLFFRNIGMKYQLKYSKVWGITF